MVEQLGLAIILSVAVSSFPLISGTTNFLVSSIRHAELLSITVMPASENLGAQIFEVSPPAEKIATLGFIEMAFSIPTTSYEFPLKEIDLPTDLSEATGINSLTGKFLSSNT